MSDREPFDVYVTKYALSEGVFKRTVEPHTPGMVVTYGATNWQYFMKSDWHRTEAEARARVLTMIERKRASIAKVLARLDKLQRLCESGAPLVKGEGQVTL